LSHRCGEFLGIASRDAEEGKGSLVAIRADQHVDVVALALGDERRRIVCEIPAVDNRPPAR